MMQLEPPAGVVPRGRVLCIQPLSEEANLSRRVLVAMAAEMARQGWIVAIPDLFGMGDSDGDSEDITLATWRADLDRLAGFGASGPGAPRHDTPLVLWGVRSGCALAVDLLARSEGSVDALLLWQPVGASFAVPAKLRMSGASHGQADEPDGRLDPEERIVVVNGYRYRRSFTDELAALGSDPPADQDQGGRPLAILHMGRRLGAAAAEDGDRATNEGTAGGGAQEAPSAAPVRLPPAATRLAERWRDSGARVDLAPVRAEPFWSSIEPVMPDEAFATTLAFLATL